MDFVFTRCRGKRTVLLPPQEILDNIRVAKRGNVKSKYDITEKQLEGCMKNLVLDGYVDYSLTDNKGTVMYVVTLTTRGEAFRREREDRIRRRLKDIGWKILLTVVAFGVSYALWSIVGRN